MSSAQNAPRRTLLEHQATDLIIVSGISVTTGSESNPLKAPAFTERIRCCAGIAALLPLKHEAYQTVYPLFLPLIDLLHTDSLLRRTTAWPTWRTDMVQISPIRRLLGLRSLFVWARWWNGELSRLAGCNDAALAAVGPFWPH
jgi:hypothetical protein